MKQNRNILNEKTLFMSGKGSKLSLSLFSVLLLLSLITGYGITSAAEPIYIGVLLPLSRPEVNSLFDGVQLCLEHINNGGGIGGRNVSLILRDTSSGDLITYAQDLAQDPRISVVIGPYSSEELFQIADIFIGNQKILISPSASSDEIFRAYTGTGNIWRTISNDSDITSIVMQHIKSRNAKSVALLSINNSYGKTFYDWIPYWAIENGVNITGMEEYSIPDQIPEMVNRLCAKNPDYLILVQSGSLNEINVVLDTEKKINASSHLYLIYPDIDVQARIQERTDPKKLTALLRSGLWKEAEFNTLSTTLPDNTLMLMSKMGDSHLPDEIKAISNISQLSLVPEAYDALLVAAAVMARYTAYPDKSPMSAANTVLLNGSGNPLPWTIEGFQSGFNQILEGNIPILTGTTGPIVFHPEGVDRRHPWYETYRIEEGKIIPDPVNYQKQTKSGNYFVMQENVSASSSPNTYDLPHGEFWAVIGALSRDWKNYRHQADALTIYQVLKERGVPDDHLILLVYDDIPKDKQNMKPGEVYHIPGTDEVRKSAVPDYVSFQVNKKMLTDVLGGTGKYHDKPVLHSDENSTVLVYLSSHGAPGGDLLFGDGDERLSPDEISLIINKMANDKKFGRMVLILESCFSGAIVDKVRIPKVLILAATSGNETSKSAIYDSVLSNWLSDEFTAQLITLLRDSDQPLTVLDFYKGIYYHVRSSHPTITKDNELLDIPADVFFGGIYHDS
jgi:glycosylphosphatidylinositol transamidase (GPIT) subunit GPI8/ABC-type branched-subunit amino acid transport system substrate-binding protein